MRLGIQIILRADKKTWEDCWNAKGSDDYDETAYHEANEDGPPSAHEVKSKTWGEVKEYGEGVTVEY